MCRFISVRVGSRWVTGALLLALFTGLNAAVFRDAPQAPDFTLTRADMGEYRLHSRKGRVVVLYFGFTHCPHVCPQTMASLSMLVARLTPEERSRTDVVFISVDPARDTPERVRAFLSRFAGEYIGLIPDEDQLNRLRTTYNLVARKVQEPGQQSYDFVHTDLVYAVGLAGRLRHAFFADTSVDSMLKDVQALLREAP